MGSPQATRADAERGRSISIAETEIVPMGQNQDPVPERDKIVTPEDAPDPDGGMTPHAEFIYTYNGHQVEILPPDTAHLIGNYWQIRIDGVIRGNYVFNSARMAAEEAKKLIDTGLFP